MNDATYSADATGYNHDLTFNIYGVIAGTPPTVGTLLASVTKNAFIPWRPAADPTCPGGTAWRNAGGTCFNGFAFNVDFDFSALNLALPEEVVYGLAFNTGNYGPNPMGPGPYESLNFGLISTPGGAMFVNTKWAGFLVDGSTIATNVFGQINYPYTPAVRFEATAVPEPTTLGLFGLGLVAIARRFRSRS